MLKPCATTPNQAIKVVPGLWPSTGRLSAAAYGKRYVYKESE